MSYQPIADYGIIGDLYTIALVGKNGSIDWCCLPRFDSPSVFGAILDDAKGGHFSLAPKNIETIKQTYLPGTNILLTRFLSQQSMTEVTDFMPIGRESGGQTDQDHRQIVRMAQAVRGPAQFRMECQPGFDYARQKAEIEITPDRLSAVFKAPQHTFALKSSQPLTRDNAGVSAEFILESGQTAAFALRHQGDESVLEAPLSEDVLLRETMRFWRDWTSHTRYHGRWREMVMRSALILKLLTYRPSGAIVAAPTTSLPEQIGGVRNWDYRCTWVRDAAFSVYSLLRLGYTEEAAAFAGFIQARAREEEQDNGPLNVLYGIDGRHDMPELTLDHLDGYRGSKPVRIGNAAAGHLQLDIYGELIDSIYLYDKYSMPLSYEMWCTVDRILNWVAGHWDQPDQSIWEVRGGRQKFTYSRLQCWVALDRGIRLANKRSFPAERNSWEEQRDRIYRFLMTQSWNESIGAFTQHQGSDTVDASVLMMPLMLFVSPNDPRMLSTLERVREELTSDSLVRRYRIGKAADDGLPGGEGYFTVCSFWLVEAMARAGQVEEARLLFEKIISFANHLGLLSEEIGAAGELLGNFPQALTHLGLISAAYALDRALNGR